MVRFFLIFFGYRQEQIEPSASCYIALETYRISYEFSKSLWCFSQNHARSDFPKLLKPYMRRFKPKHFYEVES